MLKERVRKQNKKLTEAEKVAEFIKHTNHLIELQERAKRSFTFKNYEGSYVEYLKEVRQRFDYKINEYKKDIQDAIWYLQNNKDEVE